MLPSVPFKPCCAIGSERLKIGRAIRILFVACSKPKQIQPRLVSHLFSVSSRGADEQSAGRKRAARFNQNNV